METVKESVDKVKDTVLPTIKVRLEEGAMMPKREHLTDAGSDLYANEDVFIPKGSYRTIHTGVHVEIPHGYFGLLQSKSGLNRKYGITCRGVIDEGYTGEILAVLQNIGDDYYVRKGDKVTQLIIIPCIYPQFEVVDTITGGDRGDNGFGSTGK